VLSRWKSFSVATDRWAHVNPWKWSIGVGAFMFFVGWLGLGRQGLGVMAGVIWGLAWFAITAARLCPGPREIRARRRTRTP
jgi:hypothetical protein